MFFGLGLIVFVASCTDLTETPYEEVTEENFNPTGDDIGALIAPAYTPLRWWMGWYGNIDTQEESADALLTPVRPNGWYDGGTYVRMHQHRWNENQGQPAAVWTSSFDGINAVNRVIYQLDSGTVPVEDENIKNGVLAELKALRAYYYYILLDNFGNVPIVTDFTSEELPKQSTRQEVYDFVVKELNDNIPLLSEADDESMYGRVNKWAALGVLAKVYLNAEVYTGNEQWDKVIEVTDQIINGNNRYDLESDYKAPFSRDNDTSIENIWAVPYDQINAPGSSFHMKTLKPALQSAYNLQAQPWGGSASNPQFIDTYDEDDTRLEDTWIIGPQYNDAGEEVYNFVKNVPGIQSEDNEFDHGYPVGKYEIYAGMTADSDVDYPIIRYADILMMKAEALLRDGRAGDAATIVTEVRQRAFADTDPAKATVTGAELQQGSSYNYGWWDGEKVVDAEGGADIEFGRFLDELGWEFAIEGHRRQDLIRFGVFTTKTWFNHEPNGDYRALFPIPLSAMNDNSNLVQNPGYTD